MVDPTILFVVEFDQLENTVFFEGTFFQIILLDLLYCEVDLPLYEVNQSDSFYRATDSSLLEVSQPDSLSV